MFLPIIKVQYYLQCCMPSPMPPYSYSPIMRPILSAPPPAKSVPISPAHLAGSPHYSPSSNKNTSSFKRQYQKIYPTV
ncbi:hypothetical protein NC651_014841 [Populus alba x Populus x berolinensis]|nr:hypothetical protein NC651_014841 [Populus alba x Populus x berolinensis]